MAKFESLAVDESDSECNNEPRIVTKLPRIRLEPKRHTSEIPRFLTEWNIGWSKGSTQKIVHSPRVEQTELFTSSPTTTHTTNL